MDFQVSVSSTGEDGLNQHKSENFDLILMDLNFTDGHAFDFIDKFKSLHNSKFIAISGDSDDRTKEKAKEFGFIKFFLKPVKMDELKGFIEAQL